MIKKGQKILFKDYFTDKIYIGEVISYNMPKTSMHYNSDIDVKVGDKELNIIPDNIIYFIKEDGELTKILN